MAAMISRWEFGFSRVLAFQHSGRMRDANEKHRILAALGSRVVKGAPGMLLEHVVNVLHTRDVAFANAILQSSPFRRSSGTPCPVLWRIQRAALRCKCWAKSKPPDRQRATTAVPLVQACARNFPGNAIAQLS